MRYLLSGLCLLGATSAAPAASLLQPVPPGPYPAFAGSVDPAAFDDKPRELRKAGIVTSPATVRMIAPGATKDTLYTLIGPPHFGEAITRRWNYVLRFPTGTGSETVRCRVEYRFASPSVKVARTPNVVVDRVIWQDQACADRVAAVGR